jgi:hypothetical protein
VKPLQIGDKGLDAWNKFTESVDKELNNAEQKPAEMLPNLNKTINILKEAPARVIGKLG